MDVKGTLTRSIGKGRLVVTKYSPEILLALGIISGGAAMFTAIKETLKAEEVLDKHEEKMLKIADARALVESEASDCKYTEDDAKKDKTKAYIQTGWEFAKLYAPTIILSTLSVTCILTSHGIMRKRNLALAATVATVRTAFEEYRGRVVRDLGKEMDEHFLYDTVEKTFEAEKIDDKGKTKTVKETYNVPTKASAYSRFFDESNPNFEKNPGANYMFVRSQMIYLQNKLVSQGYLFLNDVYRTLDIPITIAGQSAGWIYDYNNKENTMISFDGFDIDEVNNSSAVRAFKNGYERSCLLNFVNIKDNILNDIRRVDSSVDVI